jgi:hypothetical protein
LRNLAFDEDLPLRSLAQLMRAGVDMQRLAVDSPTAALDLPDTHRREEHDDEWLRGLSLEEREELARLAGLIEGETLDDSEAAS